MSDAIEVGSTVQACIAGPWVSASVVRCHQDGTYDVEPTTGDDEGEVQYGLTRSELSPDDEALWPKVFDLLRDGHPGIGWREGANALRRLGIDVEHDSYLDYWSTNVSKMFDLTKAAAKNARLDAKQSYRLFTWAGYSARLLAEPASDPSRDLVKFYWNGIRMGGRDPAEVGRTIGVDDALAVLGLTGAPEDASAARAASLFEKKSKIVVPKTLRALWCVEGASAALRAVHANNPEPIESRAWKLLRDEGKAWDAPLAIRIFDAHQGDHGWWVVFESGALDGAVWISAEEDGPPVRRVARSLPFFLWDLASTTKNWNLSQGDD